MKQTVEEAAIAAVHDFYGCAKCSYRTNCIYCGGTDSPSDCDANTFYAGFKKGAKWRESQIPEHISTIQDCELAVRVTKEKAIEAFRQFVTDYCDESGRKDVSEESEHYIKIFNELINK